MLLVIASRPLADPLPAEYRRIVAAARTRRLPLERLSAEETRALVGQRLQVAQVPEPVSALILARAEGNPFFSAELAYALRDAGLIQVAGGECRIAPNVADLGAAGLPDTVQGVITSRIDRLSPAQQLTLKVASVIGRTFTSRILRDIYPVAADRARLDEHLARLDALDVKPQDAEGDNQDRTYVFTHSITQEVAYNLMLFAQRRELHRAVAEWYERTYAENQEPRTKNQEPRTDRTTDRKGVLHTPPADNGQLTTDNRLAPYYSLLAHHWSKAQVEPRAIAYLERAGEQALAISALREARTFFAQALALATQEPRTRPALSEVEGTQEPLSSRAKQRVTLTRQLGEAHYLLGEFMAAKLCFEESLMLARASGDDQPVAAALIRLGRLTTDLGEYDEARARLKEGLVLARAGGDEELIAHALNNLGLVDYQQGHYAAARGNYEESLALARAAGDRIGVARVLNNLGSVALAQRAYQEARASYEESLALQQEIGYQWGIAMCLNNLGQVAAAQQAHAEARRRYQASLAMFKEIGDPRAIAAILESLGDVAFALGDAEESRAYFREALTIAAGIGAAPTTLYAVVGIARLLARAGAHERAIELLGMVLHHPASDSETRSQAEPLLNELRAALPTQVLDAALERGRAQTLEAAVDSIMVS